MLAMLLAAVRLAKYFVEGTLTLDWAAHVVPYGLIAGAVFGALMWCTVTRPLLARMQARRK
jgi:hypothetical protein